MALIDWDTVAKKPKETRGVPDLISKFLKFRDVYKAPSRAVTRGVGRAFEAVPTREPVVQAGLIPGLPSTALPKSARESLKNIEKGLVSGLAGAPFDPETYALLGAAKLIGKGVGAVKGALAPPKVRAYQQALKTLPTRVAASKQPLEAARIATNPVEKVTQVLKRAAPLRGKQEALYTAARAKRTGEIVKIGEQIPGEAGFHAQLSRLKGKLPKVEFESIRGQVTQPDVDSLFSSIERNAILTPFEKITAKTGLSKLFGAEGVAVPTRSELKLLNEVFPKDFIATVADKIPLMQKVGQSVGQILNVPRAIRASIDLSAPFRQGLFLVGRPKQWIPAFKNMFKYAFNEKSYQGLMKDIQGRPTYELMRRSRLPLTDLSAKLTAREEAIMSSLPEKIPGLGRLFRGSNRAYTGFLNQLRADVFDDLVGAAQKQGIRVEGKVLNDISAFVGSATGRGALPKSLERAAVALNTVFFSPRLMASRLNLLNPKFYVKLNPFVRKEALKSLFTFATSALAVTGLAKFGGAKVGVDPRNADFAKIKSGNTRFDILGGFQQYIRLAARLITGEHISSTTGVKTTVGEGYKPITRRGILGRFFETKLAPVTALANSLAKGKDFLGRELTVPREITNLFVPMVMQDMYELYKEKAIPGLVMASPAIFGVGVQTYAPTAEGMVHSANSVLKNYKQLMRQGKVGEARSLMEKNRELIGIGKRLEPIQENINEFKRLKKNITKNVRISKTKKKELISSYDQRLKVLEANIEDRYEELRR